MKKKQREKIHSYRLFIKIFIVVCVSTILVSFSSTFITMRVSEQSFLDTFSITNKNITDHVERNFEQYSNSVSMLVQQIQQNNSVYQFLQDDATDPLTMSAAYYQIHNQLQIISTSLSQYPTNIVVTGINGRAYSTDYVHWPVQYEELKTSKITKTARDMHNVIRYHYVKDELTNDEGMIISAKALKEISNHYIYGFIYIGMKEQDFRQMYVNYTSDGNDFLLIDQTGQVVSSNKEEWIGNSEKSLIAHAETFEKNQNDYEIVDWNHQEYIFVAKHLPVYDMYLVNLLDRQMLKKSLVNPSAVFLLSLGIVLLTLLIVFFITRKMTNSLSNLVEEIADLADNHFHGSVTVEGSYETRELATTFNEMLDELRIYVDKLVKTERKQREAELESLQRQINPHFLYNTLASVKILVEQGSKDKATTMIHSLIALLQNTIGHVGEMVTIEEELSNMKHYVYINQIRYGERIKVNYFVSPDCLQEKIPKLLIQPFIENAFFHAFNQKQTGFIQILISKKGGFLICEIVDNGDGMIVDEDHIPQQTNKRQLFSGIGVKNVHERIVLLYGEQYGVEIDSELGKGTHIKVKLPIINQKNDDQLSL